MKKNIKEIKEQILWALEERKRCKVCERELSFKIKPYNFCSLHEKNEKEKD